MSDLEEPKKLISTEEIQQQDVVKQADKLFDLIIDDSQDGNFEKFKEYVEKKEIPENILALLDKKIDREIKFADNKMKNAEKVKELIQKEWEDDDSEKVKKIPDTSELELNGFKVQYKEGLHRGTFEYWVDGKHFTLQIPADRFIVASHFLREPAFHWCRLMNVDGELVIDGYRKQSSYTSVKLLPNGQFDLAEGVGGDGHDALSDISFQNRNLQDNAVKLAKLSISAKEFSEKVLDRFARGEIEERIAGADLVLSEFPDEPNALNEKAWILYEKAIKLGKIGPTLEGAEDLTKKIWNKGVKALEEAESFAKKLEQAVGIGIKINQMDTIIRILYEKDKDVARKKFAELGAKIFGNYPKKGNDILITPEETKQLDDLMGLFGIKSYNDI